MQRMSLPVLLLFVLAQTTVALFTAEEESLLWRFDSIADRSVRSSESVELYFLRDDLDNYAYKKEDGSIVQLCDARDWAPDDVRPTFAFGRFNRITRCYVGCSAVSMRAVTMSLAKVGPNSELEYVQELKRDRYSNYNPKAVHQAYTNVEPQMSAGDVPLTYICRAKDTHGLIISRTVEVHFFRSAVVDYAHSSVEWINATTAQATCQALGTPPPTDVSVELVYKKQIPRRSPAKRTLTTQLESVRVDGDRVTAIATAPYTPADPDIGPDYRLSSVKCKFSQGRLLGKIQGSTVAAFLYPRVEQ